MVQANLENLDWLHHLDAALCNGSGTIGRHLLGTADLPEYVRVYQTVNGLKPDGIAGPVTKRHLARPRMCRVRDRLTVPGTRCRWDQANGTWDGTKFIGTPSNVLLHYYVQEAAPNLTLQQTQTAVAAAFAEICSHAAVIVLPLPSADGANIVIKFGAIDGPSGTLAYTGLPCGPDTPTTRMDFLCDNAEPWVDSLDPQQGRLDLRRVLIHEMLHFMGLEHGPDGCIMAPFYSPTIRTMQTWDIQELQLRYGPPIASSPTPPPVVPPINVDDVASITVRLKNGVTYAGDIANTKA